MISPDWIRTPVAVILAGAVAHGAYQAGVLKVLADSGVRVIRIVAASSGALNGAYFASAVRAHRTVEGAQELVELWRTRGGLCNVFRCNLMQMVARRGLSDTHRLRALLRANIRPVQVPDPEPINLRIVVSPVEGVLSAIGDCPATSYEHMLEFNSADFGDAAALERVITAVVASSSLPVMFTPTDVPGLGDCVDGGAVNNNPIGYALDGPIGDQIGAVIVVTPTVERQEFAQRMNGTELIGHLVEMLINERLYRDLRHTTYMNAALTALDALSPQTLDPGQLAAVKRAIGWEQARQLEVIPIRPLTPLPGTAFSGFFSAAARDAFIRIGMTRAQQVLHGREPCV